MVYTLIIDILPTQLFLHKNRGMQQRSMGWVAYWDNFSAKYARRNLQMYMRITGEDSSSLVNWEISACWILLLNKMYSPFIYFWRIHSRSAEGVSYSESLRNCPHTNSLGKRVYK
jgi:hypothetical protein